MTREDISFVNYILGRFEGLACGTTGDLQAGMLDTCEQLAALVAKWEKEDG